MYCGNCGKPITEDSIYCEFCGVKASSKKRSKKLAQQEKKESVPTKELEKNDIKKEPPQSNEKLEQAYYYLLLLDQAKRTANTEMLKGIGWAVLGGLITYITYVMASDGGTYLVFWGLVIYGGYIFLKGLYYRISPKSLLDKVCEDDFDEKNNED